MNSKNIPNRSDIPWQDRWKLDGLFTSDEQWEALFFETEKKIDGYAEFKGKLSQSVEILKQAIDFDLLLSRKLGRLYTYAHLKIDEDQSNQHYLGFFQRIQNLINRAVEQSSFLRPEIMAIPQEKINTITSSAELTSYQFYFERILRNRPHILNEAMEELMAMSRILTQAPSQIFSQLDNVDMKFGVINDEKGQEIELSHGNFLTFLINSNRDIRKQAFFQYYKSYEDHQNTIATALGSSIKVDLFFSRARNHETCRSQALFSDNIPILVYDNLITTVKENLSSLFEYLSFRKEILNLPELHFYDTYVPIVENVDFQLPFEEAVDTCIQALQPLGEDYLRVLKKGLLEGWVDRYENRGKRSGAYSSGCYDSWPYILMNYEPRNINSLYTLIHEAGHSMHSYYSWKHQPYMYHEYTIFVAEVASTFNETLLSKHLLKQYKEDPRMRAYILNREIDNIRGTLFRQTMFAEFERSVHSMAEKHQPVTLESMTRIYGNLLKDYFGEHLVIDDALKLEFLRIPHFYRAFYVYKYATGISAAIYLANKVLSEGASAVSAYLDFLKTGGSCFPLEQLKRAGVDMTSPEPIKKAIAHFSNLVNALKQEIKRLKNQ
ncbi:MAG: oligoendopeptidase F [Desulfobacteraceae bacterium]